MRLEPLASLRIELGPAQELGETGRGRRRIIPITGGVFNGSRLSGTVLAGGADWQLVRADGVAEIDARYTLRTDDGTLIYVRNPGYRHGPTEVIAQLAAGMDPDPSLYYMRSMPRFETGAPRYAWLNRAVCVASGARRPHAVELEVYEVA